MAKELEPDYQADDDAPWTEDQWEAFMKEGDVRTARYGELLETLHEDPDCHAKVAREMGWSHLAGDDDDDSADNPGFNVDQIIDSTTIDPLDEEDFQRRTERRRKQRQAWSEQIDRELAEEAAGDGTGPADAPTDDAVVADADDTDDEPADADDPFREDDDVLAIPAYRIADKAGMKLRRRLEPYFKPLDLSKDEGEEDPRTADISRLLGAATIGCHIVAAKIAGGHAMGYEDEVLCGNIVNCRRGLEGLAEGVRAIEELQEMNVIPPELADELIVECRKVKQAVDERIAELRANVWWS